jgi:hypothetical protein
MLVWYKKTPPCISPGDTRFDDLIIHSSENWKWLDLEK